MAGRAGRERSGHSGAPRGGRPQPAGRKGSRARGGRQPEPSGRESEPAAATPAAFRLGVVPGVMPGKWIERWRERTPGRAVELVPVEVAGQRAAIDDAAVDAALVRLPIDRDGLHLVLLYDELPVVVMERDSSLSVADELSPEDLHGEALIVPADNVLGPLRLPGTVAPSFSTPETTADAIATAATGVGVVVVPMSLARLHHRRDIVHRPLHGGPASQIALAWRRDRDGADVQDLVGIVRGRTANSSRG